MDVTGIIAEIDAQLSKLRQARELLAGSASARVVRGPGRPRGRRASRKIPMYLMSFRGLQSIRSANTR